MNIYSSLLTILLVSVLGTPALASQSDTLSYPASQRSSMSLISQDHKEVTANVNINRADAKTLLELEGIGLKRAQTIISYREKNGPFKSVEDLIHVKGIGKKTVEQNHNKITV